MVKEKLIRDLCGSIWMMMMYKIDLNELDQYQKTIKDLTILKDNCIEDDVRHWENLIDYYTSLMNGEVEIN